MELLDLSYLWCGSEFKAQSVEALPAMNDPDQRLNETIPNALSIPSIIN